MGIRGLTKYVYDRPNVFFEYYDLKDTQLVIDGYSLAVNLYASKHCTCFSGGDYDVFYEIVKDFFLKLNKCNVEAFVILDGGLERKKLSTRVKRYKERIAMLRDFQRKKWKYMFYPLFTMNVFKDVLMELEIKYTTCWFEADREIASLACFLNCPVLSCDSDFFIYGCLYIPIDKTDYHTLYVDDSNPTVFYMRCMIYDVAKFEKQINGDRCLLPFVAALKGNDYVNCDVFKKFFKHVSISSNKKAYGQDKIRAIVDWLKNETPESVTENIVKHLNKAYAYKAIRAIGMTLANYEIRHPTRLYQLGLESKGSDYNKRIISNCKYLSRLPREFVGRYNKNKIPEFVIDMIHLQKYFPRLQIEDVTRKSSHCIAFPIISGMYYVVSNLVGIQTNLNVMLKMNGKFEVAKLNHDTSCIARFNAHSLMSARVAVKMNFMYKVLAFDEYDKSRIELFDKDWKIFAMSFIYWMKNASEELSQYHFHSIVLMVLANFVQSNVGYYRNYTSFMKFKAGEMHRLSKEPVSVVQEESNSFPDLLENITQLEYLKLTQKFIKLRKFEEDVTDKGYYMGTIHVFAMLQSVFFHIIALNELLGFPCPRTCVNKIYSGTLAYNLYYYLNNKKNVTDFIRGLLKTEPNILRVYDFFVDELAEYIPKDNKRENRTRPAMKKKQRKRRKNRKRN